LLGILTNRTFLAWTSSGLETALFDFLLVCWVFLILFVPADRPARVWGPGLAALLLCLTRPDGLIFAAATALLMALEARRRPFLLPASPLLGIPVQLLWQRATYGSWTPNTYTAKVVAPWPASGVRYALSFVMEYFLWIWIAVAVALMVRWLRDMRRPRAPRGRRQARACVLGALALHALFYTLVVGGDHFEYRVFNHLIPLMPVSLIWMMQRLSIPAGRRLAILALSVVLSWPIPWTHFAITRGLTTRAETFRMFRPVAPAFPAVVRWYPAGFDRLQGWLIRHWVCVRHQEHKVFEQSQVANTG
jgi:arabinofuranosyltransferase